MPRRAKRCALIALPALLALAFGTACASGGGARAPAPSAAAAAAPAEDAPEYRPAESLLEVIAVLRRHVPDDTYRFAPARDFTGRNIYRASLLRLENLERAHEQTLRAGTWDEVIAFSKGRALERLRAYKLAAASYRNAARAEGELQPLARRGAELCDALAAAAAPEQNGAAENILPGPQRRDSALAQFEQRRARLQALLEQIEKEISAAEASALHPNFHYRAVVQEELERVAVERAAYLAALRRFSADGAVRALAALQQNAAAHKESKNANRHLMALADLYAALAQEYVQRHPPESLGFAPAAFEEFVESAARLYEAVANQDGAVEKLAAARKLEAFLAFTLAVDRDRFAR